MHLLEKIIISSILILAILLIRIIFRKKVSPAFIYSLWLLAAARILWPGMIGESPLSIMNTGLWKAGQRAISEENNRQSREYKEQKYQKYLERIMESDRLQSGQTEESAGTLDITSGEPEIQEVEISFRHIPTFFGRLEFWAARLWIGGMAVTGAVFVWQNLSFYKYLRRTRKKLKEVSAGKRRITVFTAGDELPSPCLFGLFPSIYVPERCIGGEESQEGDERLRFILEHELTHYRHRDFLWSLVRTLCLIAAWYNPLIWAAAGISLKDGELACDRGCIKRLGMEKKTAYGETLLSMVNPAKEKNGAHWNAAMMTSNGKFMKKRIEGIAQKRKSSPAAVIAAAALIILCAGAAFTGSDVGEAEGDRGAEVRTADTFL